MTARKAKREAVDQDVPPVPWSVARDYLRRADELDLKLDRLRTLIQIGTDLEMHSKADAQRGGQIFDLLGLVMEAK